jgi:hypothetical protein
VTTEEAIDRINELLDSTDPATTNTSMRIPTALRDAAALAVSELGVAPSATVMTANALRMFLEGTVVLAALDIHFEQHPEARPSLGDLAIGLADIEGSPLARQPDLLHRSAAEIQGPHPHAEPQDVLLWAEAREFTAEEQKRSAAEQKGAV